MTFPLRTDSPLRGKPWMNWVILLANVAIFVADWVWRRLGHVGDLSFEFRFCLNARDPHLLHFFTYAFLHQNWLHLGGNLLALYIFGKNVNDRLGPLGYLAFYLAGAVFAGTSFVLTPNGVPAVVGASGAVMAVMGAYLAFYPRSNITFVFVVFPSTYLIVVFFLIELLGNFAGSSGVAHIAHVAGMMFGFAVCMALLSLRLLPRDPWDFLALVQRWHRRRQYQSLVRQGFNPFGSTPPAEGPIRPEVRAEARPELECDPKVQRLQELRAEISEALAHHNLPHAALLYLELKDLDPLQVLSRQSQLDVANQLASQQFYPQAAEAYEQFLRHYPNFNQIEHVELMLGLIYARYLSQHARAKQLLTQALHRLHGERDVLMARTELDRIEPFVATSSFLSDLT